MLPVCEISFIIIKYAETYENKILYRPYINFSLTYFVKSIFMHVRLITIGVMMYLELLLGRLRQSQGLFYRHLHD